MIEGERERVMIEGSVAGSLYHIKEGRRTDLGSNVMNRVGGAHYVSDIAAPGVGEPA